MTTGSLPVREGSSPTAPSGRPARAGRPDGGRPATVAARAGTVALCTALVVGVLVPDALDHVAVAIALVGVVLGIPHGAVDHMVPFWTAGTRPGPRALALGAVSYLGVAVAAAVALILAPVPMVVAFLALSAWHFGRGEVTFAAMRAGRPVPGPTDDLSVTLVHGAVVVLLPLTLWHDRAAGVLGALASPLARPWPAHVAAVVATVVLVAVLVVAGRLVRAGRPREAAELVLVAAVFTLVSPLVAFGVYFGAWHALRHTGRLLALPGPDGPLPPARAVRRYLLHAALPTLVSITALVVAEQVVSVTAVPVALAVLLALTFPHLGTVARMDRRIATSPG